MLKVDIAGLKVDSITKKEFLDLSLKRIKAGQKTFVITPYSEFLYNAFQNPKLLEIFNLADFSLADGIGIFWAKKFLEIPLTAKSYWGKILQSVWQIKYSLAAIIFHPSWIKSALPEKIVGADLIWDLAEMAAVNNLSIYLLGGYGDTPNTVSQKLQKTIQETINDGRHLLFHKLKVVGYSTKYPNDNSIINDINKVNPDILIVAYGPIKQEQWIAENLPKLNVKLAIGLGGTLDYIAGVKSTPPKFIRYSGFEWLWRLFTQPQRIKRIFNATFGLASCLWHYKIFESLPFRPNAAVVIINKENKVLVCQRKPTENKVDIIINKETLSGNNYWQFPQGGIDGSENLTEAALREAREETGLQNLKLLKISDKTHSYIWNNALRNFWSNKSYRNKGQTQNVVYFKFAGNKNEVGVDQKEFINYKWVEASELGNIIHPERLGLTEIVLEDLKNI